MSDWRALDTAPEHQPVLVYCDGDISIGWRHGDAWLGLVDGTPAMVEPKTPRRLSPTHWLPLPPPPSLDEWAEVTRRGRATDAVGSA